MIIIASDHAGFLLKERLKKWFLKSNIKFVDVGAKDFDHLDSYVLHAKNAVEYYAKNCDAKNDKLVLICGSGVGMSIVANRSDIVRAVLANSKVQAKQARMHNDCNCLCLGARNTNFAKAKQITKVFLTTDFLGGKYLERIKQI